MVAEGPIVDTHLGSGPFTTRRMAMRDGRVMLFGSVALGGGLFALVWVTLAALAPTLGP